MTKEELEVVKARAVRTPDGPWRLGLAGWYTNDCEELLYLWQDRHDICQIDISEEMKDFVSHARQDVLSLVAEAEGLQVVLKKVLDCADGFEEDTGSRWYVKDGEWVFENKVWDAFWDAYEEARQLLERGEE